MIRGKLIGFQKVSYTKKETNEQKIRCEAYFDLGPVSDAAGVGNHTTTVTAWNEHCDWFFNELFKNKYLGKDLIVDTFGQNNSLAQSHIVMLSK